MVENLRLFILSDIHGSRRYLLRFREVIDNTEPNVIIVAGDITDFGSIDDAEEILSRLSTRKSLNIFVPGNCDPSEMLYIDKVDGFLNIHDNIVSHGKVKFIGIGGGLISPYDTNIEFTDEEFEKLLVPVERPFVLVTHSPPYNTSLDVIWNGSHIGSKAIRSYVEKYQPNLVISGHIHEARGIDNIGVSLLVNPGPAKNGYYAEAEFVEGEFNVLLRRV